MTNICYTYCLLLPWNVILESIHSFGIYFLNLCSVLGHYFRGGDLSSKKNNLCPHEVYSLETKMNQMNKLSSILEYNCYEGGKTRGSGVQLWDRAGGEGGRRVSASEKVRSE